MSEDGLYEWDEVKAESNVIGHDGITFEEARTVLESETSVEFPDAVYAERVNTIGLSNQAQVLFVVSTEYTTAGRTRIISARKATKADLRRFQE